MRQVLEYEQAILKLDDLQDAKGEIFL